MIEIKNNQFKVDSAKLEIYMMVDNLANKIKNRTNKEFNVDHMKKVIDNMATLLD